MDLKNLSSSKILSYKWVEKPPAETNSYLNMIEYSMRKADRGSMFYAQKEELALSAFKMGL